MAWGIIMTVVTFVGMIGLVLLTIRLDLTVLSGQTPEAIPSVAVKRSCAA
jgi:hypothetical protein